MQTRDFVYSSGSIRQPTTHARKGGNATSLAPPTFVATSATVIRIMNAPETATTIYGSTFNTEEVLSHLRRAQCTLQHPLPKHRRHAYGSGSYVCTQKRHHRTVLYASPNKYHSIAMTSPTSLYSGTSCSSIAYQYRRSYDRRRRFATLVRIGTSKRPPVTPNHSLLPTNPCPSTKSIHMLPSYTGNDNNI